MQTFVLFRTWLVLLCALALSWEASGAVLDRPTYSLSQVEREYRIDTWTSQDGLPPGAISGLYQARDGSIWVACQGGVARFDGNKFTVYDQINTPFFSGEPAWITEDNAGTLWIGRYYSGLVRKVGNAFVRYPIRPSGNPNEPDLLDYDVKGLIPRHQGGVWAVVGQLLPLTEHGPAPGYFDLLNRDFGIIHATAYDASNRLWVSFNTGLFILDSDERSFEPAEIPAFYRGKSVGGLGRAASGALWCGFVDVQPNQLVVGGPSYLACYKDGAWVRAPKQPEIWTAWSFSTILEDRSGAVWMPGNMNTLVRFKDNKFDVLPYASSQANEIPSSAIVDRDGVLWLGTSENVLRRLAPRRIRTYTIREGLVHDEVWSVSEASDGSILAGTEGGVSRLRPDGTFENLPMPPKHPESNVRAIVEDSAGTVWFGTIRALHRWESNTVQTVKFPGEWVQSKVRALTPSVNGGVWVGTVRGLSLCRDGNLEQHARDECLGGEEVRAVYEATDGALWVGTHRGGVSRIQHNSRLTFTTQNGLSGNTVCSIFEDSDGVIWAGTENGLSRIQNGSARAYREADGLLARNIHCVIEDNFGRLWMSSDKGVFWAWKCDLNALQKGEKLHCLTYDVSDGLPARICNGQSSHPAGCKSRDGRLWFPTPKGLIVIDPELVGAEENPPQAVVDRVRANGKLVAGTTPADVAQELASRSSTNSQTITQPLPLPSVFHALPPGSARVLEVHFSANSFAAPDKTRFRYRLLGLDDAWIEAGSRKEAYFTDLKPGRYKFELLAGNHHGAWQPRPTTAEFEIEPFFYQTWWFFCLMGVCSTSMVGGFVAWRARELRRIHELERLNALNDQRRRIARDIHDELGASLTHIVQLSDVRATASPDPAGARSRNERISSVASEAVNHINEIVWANNPEYDTLQDLIAYIREYAASYLDPTRIEVRFAFPDQVPSRNVSGLFRRGVLLIVKEVLHNAVKHARTKTLRFELKLDATQLQICISDDGCGFMLEEGRRVGNGLGSMLHRAEELRGTLKIRSAPSQGTSIHLEVPFS